VAHYATRYASATATPKRNDPVIYLTQLVYVHPGKEAVFDEFEDVAIPLITKYNGELMLRLRPSAQSVIQASVDVPYEIHLVRFDDESDFDAFAQDPERRRFLHLKEESVRATLLVKGALM
jgi:antibiotic biosynthesis monooxygenase (ABM) superfamily enzyme